MANANTAIYAEKLMPGCVSAQMQPVDEKTRPLSQAEEKEVAKTVTGLLNIYIVKSSAAVVKQFGANQIVVSVGYLSPAGLKLDR